MRRLPRKAGAVGPDLKDDKVLLAIQQRAAAAKLAQEKEAREKDAKAERDKAHIKKADKALKEDKAPKAEKRERKDSSSKSMAKCRGSREHEE